MHVWTVSEIKAGTLTQCRGVAEQLDRDPHQIIVDRRLPRWRMGHFVPRRSFSDREPDLIISCGRMAERHVVAIKRHFRNRPFIAHLQTPASEWWDAYDHVFVPRHDWNGHVAAAPHFEQMTGAPHRINKRRLQERREEARRKYVPNAGRCIAVLIGGSNHSYAFDDETIRRLLAAIEQFRTEGWTVVVTTSRRSEPKLLEILMKRREPGLHVWDRTGESPYLDYLAAADAILVTKDSITMTCEAAASASPVFTFDLKKKQGPKLASFEWFHKDMSETLGVTRRFDGRIYPYDHVELDESRRISRRLSMLTAQHHDTRSHG